jgi:hypothetical protein
MWGSAIVYSGMIVTAAGLVMVIKPIRRLCVTTRARGLAVAGAGALILGVGLFLPASESRVSRVETRLDEFVPTWQFREIHTIRIPAPPPRVYEAITRLRADEILLFHTLTWIRRGGRELPPSILNAGSQDALIDVATNSGFVRLADDVPRELVIGTVVMAPPGTIGTVTPAVFQKPLPPGFAIAAMNFVVSTDGSGGSVVSTETRVFANSREARRRFGAYWRLIYPGSAIIRRMWLRAVHRRAMSPAASVLRLAPTCGPLAWVLGNIGAQQETA